ncbi:MAG: hypothetical protein ACJ786_42495 [Catenulispora sp.]
MDSDAERDAQLTERVGELLHPGEAFRAVVLVSRADARTSVPLTRAEMSPFRVRVRRPPSQGPGARRGVQGSPNSLAVGLDEHIRNVTDPRLLALTDRRLLVLSKRLGPWRDLFRPASSPVPPLRLLWECPREHLAAAAERAGRLRLTFSDGSSVALLTPSAGVQPFLAG